MKTTQNEGNYSSVVAAAQSVYLLEVFAAYLMHFASDVWDENVMLIGGVPNGETTWLGEYGGSGQELTE